MGREREMQDWEEGERKGCVARRGTRDGTEERDTWVFFVTFLIAVMPWSMPSLVNKKTLFVL